MPKKKKKRNLELIRIIPNCEFLNPKFNIKNEMHQFLGIVVAGRRKKEGKKKVHE